MQLVHANSRSWESQKRKGPCLVEKESTRRTPKRIGAESGGEDSEEKVVARTQRAKKFQKVVEKSETAGKRIDRKGSLLPYETQRGG